MSQKCKSVSKLFQICTGAQTLEARVAPTVQATAGTVYSARDADQHHSGSYDAM